MGFPTINKFLYCLELEAAGVILGWLALIGYGVLYCYLAVIIVFCWYLSILNPTRDQGFINDLLASDSAWFVIAYMFFCFARAVSGVKLIAATRNVSKTKKNKATSNEFPFFI
jgi:hypothetical protein